MDFKKRNIKIGHSTYKVQYMDKIPVVEGEGFRFGEINTADKLISVATQKPNKKKFSEDQLKTTYYHELIHGILGEGQYLSESNNEPLVEWLAYCFVQLSKQNAL